MIDFQTNGGDSNAIEVTDEGVNLPPENARFVKLSNRNVLEDEDLTYVGGGLNYANGREIYWGFKGKFPHQLFATQETDWIPVTDLSEINLKARPGVVLTVWYSWLT